MKRGRKVERKGEQTYVLEEKTNFEVCLQILEKIKIKSPQCGHGTDTVSCWVKAT